MIQNVGSTSHTHTVTLSAVIGTSWSSGRQNISVAGIKSTDNPIVDIDFSLVASGQEETVLEDWGKIFRISTANNQITVYATENTTVSIPVQIKIVR